MYRILMLGIVWLAGAVSLPAAEETAELRLVGENPPSSRAVSIRRRCDYVAVPVLVEKDTSVQDKARQVYFQRQTAANLIEAVKKSRSGLGIKSMGLAKQPFAYLLLPLEQKSQDLAHYVEQTEKLFKTVFFSGKSKVVLGHPVLALKDPEQYRTAIIREIIYSIESLSKSLSSRVHIEIGGLEAAIRIQRVDDEHVDLYLPYTLTVEIDR